MAEDQILHFDPSLIMSELVDPIYLHPPQGQRATLGQFNKVLKIVPVLMTIFGNFDVSAFVQWGGAASRLKSLGSGWAYIYIYRVW